MPGCDNGFPSLMVPHRRGSGINTMLILPLVQQAENNIKDCKRSKKGET
jgi:hypothetical protein